MLKNNKGFTLVELLAVIVIMGILMMVAIPAVTRVIENSRKDTFVDIAKSYANAVRTLWTSDNLMCGYGDTYASGMNDGNYYILIDTKNNSSVLLDQGGKSSWGNRDVKGYVRVNVTTRNGKKITKFYVALSDGTHGIYDNLSKQKESDKLVRGDMLMNLDNSSQKDMLESIATDPFIVEEVTTCSSEGGNKTVRGISFENDSWLRISGAVRAGTYPYQVGDTKEVDMGDLGTHTVRVANNTSCTTETSETACGFVVEFVDIITNYRMNSSGNIGGWPASEMRQYLNNEILSALPIDMQGTISETTVISGHGSTPGEKNFTSIDKLYLLSTMEIYGANFNASHDTLMHETRQLDYYNGKINSNDYSQAIKKYNNSDKRWWLRSARPVDDYRFNIVMSNGTVENRYDSDTFGVSPAFRIA